MTSSAIITFIIRYLFRYISSNKTLLQMLLLVDPPAGYDGNVETNTDMAQLTGLHVEEGFTVEEVQHISPGKRHCFN